MITLQEIYEKKYIEIIDPILFNRVSSGNKRNLIFFKSLIQKNLPKEFFTLLDIYNNQKIIEPKNFENKLDSILYIVQLKEPLIINQFDYNKPNSFLFIFDPYVKNFENNNNIISKWTT